MFPFVAVLFLIVPIIEIYLLIQVGEVIGAGWTILLVVLTAVIGVWLLRIQGLSTLMRAQQRLQANELPASELLEGMALVIAGAFLLTPGFATDTLGFLLLIPFTRQWMVKGAAARMVMSASVHRGQGFGQPGQPGDVIDGVKYRREDEYPRDDPSLPK